MNNPLETEVVHTFKEAFDLLARIQSSKAENTYVQCIQILCHLEPWFEKNHPLLDGFETDFEEIWSEYIAAQKKINKGRKLGHDRRYLVMALRRASIKGWIKRSFSKTDFPLMEATEPIGKYISKEDMQKLLDWLERRSPRTWLQVQMAYCMGMRISEILKLREEEIDWARSEIKLDPKRLKTRRARKIGIPIPDGIRMRLEAICAEYDSDYVFPMIEKHSVKLDKPQATNDYWWTLARQETGVKCRFHDLRHSYLSNAVKAGIPLDFISKVAGATPQVISGIYSHMEESDKNTFRDLSNSLFNKK